MPEIKKDALEKALEKSGEKKTEKTAEQQLSQQKMSREQEIFFHQGALTTLMNERNELIKMMHNAELVMQAHLKRLEELGVKIKRETKG